MISQSYCKRNDARGVEDHRERNSRPTAERRHRREGQGPQEGLHCGGYRAREKASSPRTARLGKLEDEECIRRIGGRRKGTQ